MKEKRDARKRSVKRAHDRKTRKLSEIDVGQSVFFQHKEGQNCRIGKITDILGPNTYLVDGPYGGTYRRNRVHMRPTRITPKVHDMSPIFVPRTPDEALSALPLEEPSQELSPPTDIVVQDRQRCGVQESLAVNRPRREIKPPIRFKDYVSK